MNNSASSNSLRASAGGGAISLRSSVAKIMNCSFERNYISVNNLVAFAGGGALHVVNPSCDVTAQDVFFFLNDASSSGQGGALLVSVGATFEGSNLLIDGNSAGKGGGVLIDASKVHILNSVIRKNVATRSGGGIFCSSYQANNFFTTKGIDIDGLSTIILNSTSFLSNTVIDPQVLGVGSDLFVFGSVVFVSDSSNDLSMSGVSHRDIMAAVVSVITNSPLISLKLSCMYGTMLRIAPTSLSNILSLSMPPSNESMSQSKCFPACLEVPSYEVYVAASGFLASCTPCPNGMYNLGASNSTDDTVDNFCFDCPFGAYCQGGNKVTALESYWGWKLSESSLSKEFILLPEGYGCVGDGCEDINSCGANHSSVLCGGCKDGFSAAFFTTNCVIDEECHSYKLWILVCLATIYSFLYTVYFRYDVNLLAAPSSGNSIHVEQTSISRKQEKRSSAFYVLMWYYQLTGLLLSMPNSMKFLDGESIILNIIGLVFGTVPASQVLNFPSLVFCTSKGSAPADILFANLMFYFLWAGVMIALSFQCVWLPIFKVCHSILNMAPDYWDNYESACEAMALWGTAGKFLAVFLALKWTLEGVTWVTVRGGFKKIVLHITACAKSALFWIIFVVTCKRCKLHHKDGSSTTNKSAHAPVQPGEVRGKAWLDFGVTAYSAFMTLLIQFTTCVTIEGYQEDGIVLPEVRWFYDGRIVCLSDSGERPGRWQIAALISVVILTFVPFCLALYMERAIKKPEGARNVFEISGLPAYMEQFNPSNRHWFTVMYAVIGCISSDRLTPIARFYQRIALSFAIFYTVSFNAPFIRGILAWFVCFATLALDLE
jgi:hypothetical protein